MATNDSSAGVSGSVNSALRPTARQVAEFHIFSDKDSSADAQHHTLGTGTNQASPGSHNHDGGNSVALLANYTISGSRSSGAALVSVIEALVQLGATDSTIA